MSSPTPSIAVPAGRAGRDRGSHPPPDDPIAATIQRGSSCHPFTLWPSGAVRITEGADKVGSYRKGSNSLRRFCSVCGGHLMTEHPQWKLIDVHAAIIPDLPSRPGVHVNCGEAVPPIREGLPRQPDFPGGTGRLITA